MTEVGRSRAAGWGMTALLVAIFAVYAPSLSYPFVWDDMPAVAENPRLASTSAFSVRDAFVSTAGGHWQPLTWMSYAVDVAIAGGPDPGVMRLTNVVLHAACAVLVWWIAVQLLARAGRGDASWAAVAAAAAFALHPLRVESVAWVTERRDVLSGALLLASAAAWLSARERAGGARTVWLAAALALHGGSMLAKAWGAVMPLVVVALAWTLGAWGGRRATARDLFRAAGPFVVAALPCAAAALWAQRSAGALSELGALSLGGRLDLAARSAWFYVGKTLVPSGLAVLYERDPVDYGLTSGGCAALAALALALGCLWCARRSSPGALAAAVAYLALLAPVSGLFQSGPQRAADRYSYLACIPIAVAFGFAVARVAPRRQAAVAVAIALAGGALVSAQLPHWRDELALWTRAASIQPDGIFVLGNLGLAHRDRARVCAAAGDVAGRDHHYSLAEQHLRRSRDLALAAER